jgi:alternate signal-mediated exported protein
MNKLTKGAIATAAGVILLMGGAGTLATWNSSATVGAGQSIVAGSLAVSTPTATGWSSQAGAISNIANFRAVPGDVLTYTATYTLAATGDNLKFTVATTPGAITASSAGAADTALAGVLTSTAAYTVTGSNISAVSGQANTYKVASNSGTSTVTVTMTVTFPSTAGNTTQLGSVNLGTGAITLTQV